MISTLLMVGVLMEPTIDVAHVYGIQNRRPRATTTTTLGPTTTTTTTTLATATDWTSAMLAVWRFEESAATNADNAEGTAANDLTDTGSVARDSTNKKEGTQAADYDGVNDGHSCNPVTTCTELNQNGGDVTFGCWSRITSDAADGQIMRNKTGNSGFQLKRESGDDSQTCIFGSGANNINVSSGAGTFALNEFYHNVCIWDASQANEIRVYLDATLLGQDDRAVWVAASDTFELASAGDLAGQLDECFFDNVAWTAAEVCRVCSCGVNGAGCTCNGAAYISEGLNDTDCGGCALPACDAVAPS